MIIITFTTDPFSVTLHRLLICPCLLFFSLHSFDYPAKTGCTNLTFSCSAACVEWQSTTQRRVMFQTKRDKNCRVWPWLTRIYWGVGRGLNPLSDFTFHMSLVLSGMVWPNVLRCSRIFRTTRRAHEIRTYARLALPPLTPKKKGGGECFHYCHVNNLLLLLLAQ